MSKLKLPKKWFDAAFDVIRDAKLRSTIDDYKLKSRLNTYSIGQSYSYRLNVLDKLIRDEVVKISDNRLEIGTIENLDWLDEALENGNQIAWELVHEVIGETDEVRLYNDDVLKRIGNKGEEFVIEELYKAINPVLHAEVKHIAKTNDMAGFDIYTPSIKNSDNRFMLEVKTSTKDNDERFGFYLSRNEYEKATKNKNWCIVCVSLTNSKLAILGHVYSYQIESRLPRDMDATAMWMSSRVSIEKSILRPGLP